jgi:hypothetical protein
VVQRDQGVVALEVVSADHALVGVEPADPVGGR